MEREQRYIEIIPKKVRVLVERTEAGNWYVQRQVWRIMKRVPSRWEGSILIMDDRTAKAVAELMLEMVKEAQEEEKFESGGTE